MKVAQIGELALLEELAAWVPGGSRVLLGLGDDCAAVSLRGKALLTTDSLVEGVHFERSWASPAALGRKAFTVNASDIAAMGGAPAFALLSLGLPADFPVADLREFFRAFVAEAGACGAALVGGNLSAAPCLVISATVVGDAPYGAITRAGMRVGDELYVTGTLGDAALGLRQLRQGEACGAVVKRFLEPTARLKAGQTLARRKLATAMIDVSDGLVRDLGHLCARSGVGAVVEAWRLPLSGEYRAGVGLRDWGPALTGGEDYELLFAVPPQRARRLDRVARECGCPITRIGRVIERDRGVVVVDESGHPYEVQRAGHDHFAA